LPSSDEEYLTPNNVAEMTPVRRDRAARPLTATRLHYNSPLEAPTIRGQNIPNLNHYHSDSMEISGTLWLPHKSDWWCQHDETDSMDADVHNMARAIFSIIPHGVGVEASSSLGGHVVNWCQSLTTGETLCEQVVVREFACANNAI